MTRASDPRPPTLEELKQTMRDLGGPPLQEDLIRGARILGRYEGAAVMAMFIAFGCWGQRYAERERAMRDLEERMLEEDMG